MQVTAIMGPSGAGKTSFMNCLMGKIDSSWTRGGMVRINGQERQLSDLRKIIGHVPQDDIMMRELTVWDNLMYSAKVRLPREWSSDQIEKHVQAIVECLNLTGCKNTNVGDERERGIRYASAFNFMMQLLFLLHSFQN
jgi:ABC-type multidrug transport system ATPase subunit